MQDDCVKNQYDCMRVIDLKANCVRVSETVTEPREYESKQVQKSLYSSKI